MYVPMIYFGLEGPKNIGQNEFYFFVLAQISVYASKIRPPRSAEN